MIRYWRCAYRTGSATVLKVDGNGGQTTHAAAKRTLTPERNALGMQVFEACEWLRWWWRNGVVTGTATGCLIPPRAQSEAQLITALLGDVALVGDDIE
jgi:hypothetical protein